MEMGKLHTNTRLTTKMKLSTPRSHAAIACDQVTSQSFSINNPITSDSWNAFCVSITLKYTGLPLILIE